MFTLFINYNDARDDLFEKFERSLQIKTAAAKLPQNESWNTTMFLELFLERLSCLCEILGRECMQAFCSSWTPNTHNTARFNVIIIRSERRKTASKLNNPSMLFDTQKRKVPRECCFLPPTHQTHNNQPLGSKKNVIPGCQQQQNLTTEGRISVWGTRGSVWDGCSH